MIYHYSSTAFKDPGYLDDFMEDLAKEDYNHEEESLKIHSHENQNVIEDKKEKTIIELKFCWTCNRYKVLDSHHCFVCGRCVIGFDHHCRNTLFYSI